MNVPGRGENLAAVQRGSTIIVQVTLPAFTTEGVVIKQNLRLDLRIGPKPAGEPKIDTWSESAQAIGGAVVANGVADYHIPAKEWIGKQVLIAVKVIGANGRDAGWSPPVELTVAPPPEPPRALTAEAVAQGVRLTWQGAESSFVILRRGPEERDYTEVGKSPKPEYIDTTAEFGKHYSYLVQARVKAAQSEAQSDLSNEAGITPLDTFAAAAPVGLAAVPSTASIELVWERNGEPNVIGYRVYRALGSGNLERLADTVLPAYSDRKIETGKTYRYAVSAVKSNQVESKLSEPVEVNAP
ncbi:MAG TPA: hypothetical protein VMR62_23665 [Bryobacteraceae bacterium]|nr:hypothetical protein [Bryobacteraceae bacterium]